MACERSLCAASGAKSAPKSARAAPARLDACHFASGKRLARELQQHSTVARERANTTPFCLRSESGAASLAANITRRYIKECEPELNFDHAPLITTSPPPPLGVRPFTRRYKMSAVAHAKESHRGVSTDFDPVTTGSDFVCFMGAPEKILEHCCEILVDDTQAHGAVVEELTDERREEIRDEYVGGKREVGEEASASRSDRHPL